MEKLISRIVMFWVIMIFISIGLLYNKMNEEAMLFYNFGPNNNLLVFGLNIDTYPKYIVIVIYCFINSLIRTLNKDILVAYLINSIQNISIMKNTNIHDFAYEVTYAVSIYAWTDYYIYMNLLFAQVDMIIIEITSDLVMSTLTTRYYLHYKIDKQVDQVEAEAIVEEEKNNEIAIANLEICFNADAGELV
jgi:hypothetical protein